MEIYLLLVVLLLTLMTSSRAAIEGVISEACRPEDGMVLCNDVCYWRHEVNFKTCNVTCSDDEFECEDACYPRNMAIDCLATEAVRYLSCHPDEFQCVANKRCIPRSYVKDGTNDCTHWVHTNATQDTSDEDQPLPSCDPQREFRCPDSFRCIPRHMVMDGETDCPDNSDEAVQLTCDDQTERRCAASGRCIPRYRVNDGHADCADSSDEHVTPFDCHEQLEFTCGESKRCIPRQWIGNSIRECQDGEDEEHGRKLDCFEHEFACADRLRCLPPKYRCDGIVNCNDGSDEDCSPPTMTSCHPLNLQLIPWSIPLSESIPIEFDDVCSRDVTAPTAQHVGLKCKTVYYSGAPSSVAHATSQRRVVPQHYIRNNISICADRRQDRCHDGEMRFLCARCLDDDGVVIATSQLCDGVVDCRDLSDECSCANSDVVAPLCDDVYGAGGNETARAAKLARVCKSPGDDDDDVYGKFCHQRRRRSHANESSATGFCDGIADHADKVDECSWTCLRKRKAANDVTGYMTLCFPFLNVSSDGSLAYFRLALDADGRVRLSSTAEDGMEEMFGVDHNDFVYSNQVQRDLNFLCQYDGVECPWLFQCADGVNWVDLELVCDLVVDCPDRSDELNCSADTHFYCATSASGTALFVGRDRVLDGTPDCPDSSDECAAGSEGVIKSGSMRSFAWVVAVFGCVSGTLVLVRYLVKVKRSSCNTSASCFVTILLSSLMFCDLLMSAALLLLSHNSSQMLGAIFCQHRFVWLTSVSCRAVGILALASTQTVINLLVLMTVIRLIVAYKPALTSELNRKIFHACHVAVYVISALLACLPLIALPYKHVIRPNPFLGNAAPDTISDRAMSRYYDQTRMMTSANLTSSPAAGVAMFSDWYFNSAEGRRRYPRRAIDVAGTVGYYASSRTCFPYFFDTSPAFSWALIVYDVMAIACVAIGCVFAHRKVRTNKRDTAVGRIKRKTNKRIDFIVFIRFVSTCFMFFVALANHDDPEVLGDYYLGLFALNPLVEPVILSGVDRAIRTQSMLIIYLVRKSSGRHFGGGSGGGDDSDVDDVEMNERR